jgi:hypothetical protein
MKEMGTNGPIKKNDYRDWPLFKEFRNTNAFRTTCEEIFGCQIEPVVEANATDPAFFSIMHELGSEPADAGSEDQPFPSYII